MLRSKGWELLVPQSAPEPSLPAGLAGAGQENISPAASVLLEVSVLGGTSSLPGSPLPRGEPRAPSPGGISEGFLSSSAGGGASTPTSSTRIVSWLDMTMTCRGVPKRPSAPGAGPRLLGSPRPMGLGLGEPPVPHLLHGNVGSPEQFCSCSCSFAPLDAKATESSSQGCGEPRRGAVFLQLLPPPPCPVCPYLLVDRQRGLLGLHGFGVHGVPGEAGEGRGRRLTPSSCCKRGTPQFVPEPPGTAGPRAGSRTCLEENVPGGCGRVGVPPPEGLGLWG